MKVFACFAAVLAVVTPLTATTLALVDFETVPVLAPGPSTFGGAAQTVVVPGVATFTGGTVLGFATNFPAIGFATIPNVYGTANGVAGYLETLTITTDPINTVTEVSFPIFNGENFIQSYVATAFNGASQVAQQTFLNLPTNFNSGFAIVDLLAPNITSVTITPVGAPASFDFLIDSVAFNESVEQAFNAPEPVSFCLVGAGLFGVVWLRRRKLV
jgi:hypothetical protein